jgi:hypothetical protein
MNVKTDVSPCCSFCCRKLYSKANYSKEVDHVRPWPNATLNSAIIPPRKLSVPSYDAFSHHHAMEGSDTVEIDGSKMYYLSSIKTWLSQMPSPTLQ